MVLERIDIDDCQDPAQVVLHRQRYDFTLARLGSAEQVLEIGTGPGVFTKELLPRCGNYIGIEYDGATCSQARRRTENKAEIIEADARCLPFEDNRFSFIICLEVLEHLGDFAAAVRSIYRCLRPDGTVIISVPYRRRGGKSLTNPFHLYEPGERELVSLLEQDFEMVEVYYQYFWETWLMILVRTLHLRWLFGLGRFYADLTEGHTRALARLRIDQRGHGMRITLIAVAKGKKKLGAPKSMETEPGCS